MILSEKLIALKPKTGVVVMESDESVEEELLIWEKRLILMSAFGFVGLGALVGACSVYIRYIRLQVEKHVAIHSISAPLDRDSSTVQSLQEEDHKFEKIKAKAVGVGTEPQQDGSKSVSTLTESTPNKQGGELFSIETEQTTCSSKKCTNVGTDELDNVEFFFISIDELLEGSTADQHDAYGRLKSTGDKLKNNCDYWWRLAKATHIEAQMAEQRQDKDSQKRLLISAVSYAEKALKINESSADAHKWFAITSGSRGEFLKINERIQSGYVFKQHVDRALELNPSDSVLHHLLGRFCFEVSQLSWVERRVAATLFSNPPSATVQEALHHFLESEKLGKPLIENRMYLAKCYISTNDNQKAAYWLKSAAGLTAVSPSDKKAQGVVNDLMNKYKKYL